MRVAQAYLAIYNIFQGLGWAYCLWSLVGGLAQGERPAELYSQTGWSVRECPVLDAQLLMAHDVTAADG